MTRRSAHRAALAFALAVLLIGGSSAALVETAPVRAASAVHAASSGAFSVTAVAGFSFTPNTFDQLPLGTNVTVTFTDADSIPHTFTIIDRQGVVIPSSTSDVDPLYQTYGALFTYNLTGNGDQYIGSFQSPATAGWYEFVCLESGHFANGMYGFIAFGEALPGNLTVSAADTDPGVAVFIIVGTIVSLVVIALVLGFVVGRRRGSTYEMPPQRLGYLEPEAPGTAPPAPEPEPPPGGPRG
jgi:plastocyanin